MKVGDLVRLKKKYFEVFTPGGFVSPSEMIGVIIKDGNDKKFFMVNWVGGKRPAHSTINYKHMLEEIVK